MSRTTHAHRIVGALTVLLALAVTGAMAAPADAVVKRSILVELADLEASIDGGSQHCSGRDTVERLAFTGSRTETQMREYVHECGSALIYQQATVEARCPAGYRSCTVHVTVTTALYDLRTGAYTLWGPVEGPDHHVVMYLGDLGFDTFVHSQYWFK